MTKTVIYYLHDSGYITNMCNGKCNGCPIKFMCYTEGLAAVVIPNKELFNRLADLWGTDDWIKRAWKSLY
jgi:hypothetical protein